MMVITDTSTFPQLLMILEIAGAKYYFAERGPVTINIDDVPTMFHGGMVVSSFTQEADLLGTSATSRQVSVTVDFARIVEIADLVANGVALYAATGTVYQYAGGDFEAAEQVVHGRVSAMTYADPAAPNYIGFTIDRDLVERAYTHPAKARVQPLSYASIPGDTPDDLVGKYYPIPIGEPGIWAPSLIGYTVAYEAVVGCYGASIGATSDYRIVVALGSVEATSAYVWLGNVYGGTADLVETIDDYNNPVTYLDLSTYTGTATDFYYASDAVNVALIGGGVPAPSGGSFRGLGDLIVWALSRSSLAENNVDWGRQLALVDELNSLGRVDTYIVERVKVLDWLVSDVLSVFPVFSNDAGQGLYIDIWRYDATLTDAEINIDVSIPGYERRSAVGYEEGTPTSVITVEGHRSIFNDAILTQVQISGDPDDAGDSSIGSNPDLIRSFELFGRNEMTLTIEVVQDTATLSALSGYFAAKYALPIAIVTYAVPWRKVSPRIGQVCRVTDAVAGFADRLGIVRGFVYADGELTLSLSMLSG